jgi:ribonuclease D
LLNGLPIGNRTTRGTSRLAEPSTKTEQAETSLLDDLVEWRARHAKAILQHPDEVCTLDDLGRIAHSLPKTVDELGVIVGLLTAHRLADGVLSITRTFAASPAN